MKKAKISTYCRRLLHLTCLQSCWQLCFILHIFATIIVTLLTVLNTILSKLILLQLADLSIAVSDEYMMW